MTAKRKKGDIAEAAACRYIEKRGGTVIARNYACRSGEIDIICDMGGELAFVEVRCRETGARVSAVESVDAHKQRRIVLAAQHFLAQNPRYADAPMRFDVVAVTSSCGEIIGIEHLPDAFGVS